MSTSGRVLHFSLQEFPAEGPPSEFPLFRKGPNAYQKEGMAEPGQITFDEKSATELMRRFQNSGRDKMVLDYDHASSNRYIQDKIAAGWFKPAIRDGELWATDVTWTPKAEAHIKNKEIRFYSPTVELDDKGRVIALRPCAVTNDPALCNLRPLFAASAQTNGDKPMQLVNRALGIAEDADEATCLSAVHKTLELKAKVLSLSGKATLDEAWGVLTAMKEKAEQTDALAAELSAVKAEKETAEVAALLDEAVKDGRVPAAKRAGTEAICKEFGVKALKMHLSQLSKTSAPAIPATEAPASAPAAHGLSADQLRVIKLTGLTPEEWLEHKTHLESLRASGGL